MFDEILDAALAREKETLQQKVGNLVGSIAFNYKHGTDHGLPFNKDNCPGN